MNGQTSSTPAPAVAGDATRLPVRALAICAAAVLTALSARVAVPLPGSVVPFTLQPVAVLLAGVLLGARAGMTSQLVYLAAGATGLPVFAAGGGLAYLLGPTGGYLLAFPLAAAAAGWLAGREGGAVRVIAGSLVGLAILHAGGLAWVAAVTGVDTARGVGIARFALGDLLKVALVAVIALGPGRRVRSRRGS